MKRDVVWSEEALRDFDGVIACIAARNPQAALKLLASIRATAERLGSNAIGRPGRVAGTYEKSVVGRPYTIAYALDPPRDDAPGRVVILRVIHGARNWPAGRWPE